MNAPLVSVLIANYNGLPFLAQAIDSVLQQTYENFELIIVDDGSNDGSRERLVEITDPRIKLILNSKNLGPGLALKKGVEIAQGKYVARLDADDIMLPTRLLEQVIFMEQNISIGLLGGGALIIGEDDKILTKRIPSATNDLSVQWKLLIKNPFISSTVMIRREIMVSNSINYRNYIGTEDYDLWTQLLRHTRGAQLPSVVGKYRINFRGLTATRKSSMHKSHLRIATEHINATFPHLKYSEAQVAILLKWLQGRVIEDCDVSLKGSQLYLDLLKAYIQKKRSEAGVQKLVQVETQRVFRRLSLKKSGLWAVPVLTKLIEVNIVLVFSSVDRLLKNFSRSLMAR